MHNNARMGMYEFRFWHRSQISRPLEREEGRGKEKRRVNENWRGGGGSKEERRVLHGEYVKWKTEKVCAGNNSEFLERGIVWMFEGKIGILILIYFLKSSEKLILNIS